LYSSDLPISQTKEGFQRIKLDEDELSQHGGIALNPMNSPNNKEDESQLEDKENHAHNL
jgi:hypothetical protein